MLTLIGLALPALTSLFASLIPILLVSLAGLINFALSRASQIP